ncbi:type II and III secretion system protein family protein [Candidatus Liberibacter asiaticus]
MRYLQRTFFTMMSIFLFSSNPSVAKLPPIKEANAAVINISDVEIGKGKKISIGLNKVIILQVPIDVQDVLVSDPTKADVVVHSPRTMYLFGKNVGQANVILIGHDGKQMLNLDILIERDIAHLEMTLRRFIADSNIRVEMVSDTVVLHGMVRTIQDSQRAVELSETFLSQSGRNQYANSSSKKVMNLLNIAGEDQVTLKVTIAEVRRDILKQIGFQHSITGSSSGPSKSFAADFGGKFVSEGGDFSVKGVLDRFSFETVLHALERATAIRTLAEPTLTAISGQSASFTSGGQHLYKTVSSSTGATSVTTHDYGVVLHFTPTVLSPGRIGLRIQTEVSEPVIGVNAGDMPSYRVRKADTTVELPSGGTIVLAGLLKDDIQQLKEGIPLLSKIPILGALFRNSRFNREETEIFIAATPFLVKPVAMRDLSRPDDHYSVEDDAKAFFFNRVNKIYGPKEASEVEGQNYKGAIGFIYK